MATVVLLGRQFSYTITRRSSRSLRLKLENSNTFSVGVPRLTPNFVVDKFIQEHASWIVKNSLHLKKDTDLTAINQIKILDDTYYLHYEYAPRESLVIFPETHDIYLKAISFSTSHLKTVVNKKFRPLALKLIKENLAIFSKQFGFKYGQVSVRNQSTRFGSCSHNGNLSFNWQIIFLPKAVFLHILLHELTHLDIKDHSAKFWRQLTVYDSDTKAHNQFLKHEAPKLFLV